MCVTQLIVAVCLIFDGVYKNLEVHSSQFVLVCEFVSEGTVRSYQVNASIYSGSSSGRIGWGMEPPLR